MRIYEYGRFSSEVANIVGRKIWGRSVVVDGATSNDAGTGEIPTDFVNFQASQTSGWAKLLIKVVLDTPRSIIGHTPIVLLGQLRVAADDTTPGAFTFYAYRLKVTPDYTDCTYRNRDNTGPVRWYGDAYSPVPGQDIDLTPFDTQVITAPATDPTTWNYAFDVTSPLIDSLRRGTDLEMMLVSEDVGGNGLYIWWGWTTNKLRPYMRVYYLFPIEFFQAGTTGDIALESMVNNQTQENLFYLGALERSETGTPVKGFIKNFSARTLPLVEILDDHPEWSDPVQTAGAGTGSLDYVSLSDGAHSQKYTIKFSSGSAYEVKAEAYRDNIAGDHTSYDADPDWVGDTSGDWTSPDGYLTIPTAGWQPGTGVNDEFEVYVKGNSTDSTWPADSAEQIQITHDSTNAPDNANWRPINGRRSKTTASVTVDATTKKFPCKAIDSAQWPVGTRAFVGDGTNLHEGTIASAQEAELGAAVFAGVGLDDLVLSGNYNGTIEDDLVVEIEDDSASPELFKVSWDGGSTWTLTGQQCSTSGTAIGHGVIATFGATTGHTNAENWTATVQPFAVELESLTNDSTVYAAGSRVGTSLPVENLGVAIWGTTTADAGVSESPANRIYLQGPSPEYLAPASAGFLTAQTIRITDITDPDVGEYGTIDTVGSTYIDLDANLTQDYPAGAIVTVSGSGEAPFWLRAVASGSTTEQLKQARLNVRV